MSDEIETLLEHVKAIGSIHELDYRLRCLKAWQRRAEQEIGFAASDRVVILDSWEPPRSGSGWADKWESLMPGQVGTVREMLINPETLKVSAATMWDTEWSVFDGHDGVIRRHSALRNYDDTADEDRRHLFYFPVKHLRLATPGDQPLQMPIAEHGVSS